MSENKEVYILYRDEQFSQPIRMALFRVGLGIPQPGDAALLAEELRRLNDELKRQIGQREVDQM